MKEKFKNNFIYIIAFILGGVIFSGITYAATVDFTSGDVYYSNSTSGLSATNVKSAIDEIYNMYNSGTATADDIIADKTAFINGSLKSGNIVNHGDYSKSLESEEEITLPAGYYRSILIQAPTEASAIYQNMYTKTLEHKETGGSGSDSGYINFTVPNSISTGLMVYTLKNGSSSWDHAGTDQFGGKLTVKMSCETPSNTIVHAGDVIKFKWSSKWEGESAWNISATGKVQITIMY